MAEFNTSAPPPAVTNPKAVAASPYPRHGYKHVAEPSDRSLIVAWKGKTPIHNDVIQIADAADEAVQVKAGYSLVPALAPSKNAGKGD